MRTTLRFLFLLVLFGSCRKSDQLTNPVQFRDSNNSDPQSCDFGIAHFNTAKRQPLNEIITAQTETIQVPQADAVLLLDFDGYTVSNTPWNYSGNIVCSPANLSVTGIDEIIRRVTEDFSPFDILVTTNENIYNQCNTSKRMRVIITETWEWFGQAGGVSFIGSFTWGNNTPCFVFSVLLNYNIKKISEAVSHEAGHTLGLYHQSIFDPACFLLGEYYSGIGTGELSWGPIMGLGYYRNVTTWRRGTSIYGCNNIQDDINVITSILNYRDDDHSNQFNSATHVNSNLAEGCINNSADVDFFLVDLNMSFSVVVLPFNAGINNEGANVDLMIKIYSRNRNLIAAFNDPNSLSVSTTLSPGRYYISIETTENANTSRYGQLGNYSLSIK